MPPKLMSNRLIRQARDAFLAGLDGHADAIGSNAAHFEGHIVTIVARSRRRAAVLLNSRVYGRYRPKPGRRRRELECRPDELVGVLQTLAADFAFDPGPPSGDWRSLPPLIPAPRTPIT